MQTKFKLEHGRRRRFATWDNRGMTLIEIIVAVGIFAVVSYIITSLLDSTLRTQRQAELKYDLQTFVMRTIQDIDCAKTLKVGETGALYNKAAGVYPTNSTCGSLTLRTSSGNVILAPDSDAENLFVGAGPISNNWWAKAECDESLRSITVKVALKKKGSWTEFGKNPLRDTTDSNSASQHYMHWGNSINPIVGGAQKIKLCEQYFENSESENSSCNTSNFGIGYNSKNLRCGPLPSQPTIMPQCGIGSVMVNFNMMTNTPVCRFLTTADLDSTDLINSMKSKVIPSCYDKQIYVAATSNTAACTNSAQTSRCSSGFTNDYFPAFSAGNCSAISGYSSGSGGLFDIRVLTLGIGK